MFWDKIGLFIIKLKLNCALLLRGTCIRVLSYVNDLCINFLLPENIISVFINSNLKNNKNAIQI